MYNFGLNLQIVLRHFEISSMFSSRLNERRAVLFEPICTPLIFFSGVEENVVKDVHMFQLCRSYMSVKTGTGPSFE